jgi:hypothetical protein
MTTKKRKRAARKCGAACSLLPCPFCGNKKITMWPMGGWYSPLCEQCGATICENCSTGPDTAKQIAAWNRRANTVISK